ncbi:hypothetical protein [Caenibacillus caldisaponilyticus]|uniref:hypothetical protein n=1 Tax=Caenibacillus caldisaponilyticus TaxID=1674942 RepID=UPI001177DC6B|nr:hypothetical protein [Caenibacillus caldisaponilyticus]
MNDKRHRHGNFIIRKMAANRKPPTGCFGNRILNISDTAFSHFPPFYGRFIRTTDAGVAGDGRAPGCRGAVNGGMAIFNYLLLCRKGRGGYPAARDAPGGFAEKGQTA